MRLNDLTTKFIATDMPYTIPQTAITNNPKIVCPTVINITNPILVITTPSIIRQMSILDDNNFPQFIKGCV